MLLNIIAWSLENRFKVIGAALVVALIGAISLRGLTIDAFPDTTPVQVQVNTDVPGLVATEVERLVTFPVELVMGPNRTVAHSHPSGALNTCRNRRPTIA